MKNLHAINIAAGIPAKIRAFAHSFLNEDIRYEWAQKEGMLYMYNYHGLRDRCNMEMIMEYRANGRAESFLSIYEKSPNKLPPNLIVVA